MPRITLRDVARACGVSPATVSKALNPHADRCDLNAETQAKVVAVARELGFRPSTSHGRRTRRLHRNIGLLWGSCSPHTSGAYANVLETIGYLLAQQGWRLLHTPVLTFAEWRDMQIIQRLDGVLVVSHAPEEVLEDLATRQYPAVLLNLFSPVALPQFLPDEAGGVSALTDHLADLGHRHLLYLPYDGPSVGHFSETLRPSTIAEAAARRGVSFTHGSGRDLAAAVAACRNGITAVICYDWLGAPKFVQALQQAGLRVPLDISVACCCDVDWFAYVAPAMTAVEIPMCELARRAVRCLLARIDDPEASNPSGLTLPAQLQIRGSTAPPPI